MSTPTDTTTEPAPEPAPEPSPAPPVSTALAVRSPLDSKIRYALALADAGLLPAVYRGRPANVLVAIEYGEMLGLAPIAAMQAVHVIEGKPSASAELMKALVRRAGHKLRITGGDDMATCEIIRDDDPDFTYRSVWTIERARQAELVKKDVWKHYPAGMLKARAVSECVRDACSEVMFGVVYTPEELGANVNADGEVIGATATQIHDANIVEAIQLRDAAAAAWDDVERLRELHEKAKMAGLLDALVQAVHDEAVRLPLGTLIGVRGKQLVEEAAARIAATEGHTAGTPEPSPAPGQPDADGIIDAEIVTDPPADSDPTDTAAAVLADARMLAQQQPAETLPEAAARTARERRTKTETPAAG